MSPIPIKISHHGPAFLLRLGAAMAVMILLSSDGLAQSSDREDGLELFEKHVRPTLLQQCVRCHGEKKQQGGLRLDSRPAWMAGGDSGPVIVPGNPDESLLLQAMMYEGGLEMPPKGKLPQSTLTAFGRWIELGAPDPREPNAGEVAHRQAWTMEEGRRFWSFQPIRRPAVPEVRDQHWPRSDIDRFILAKLEQHDLRPVKDADHATLVRRVYFDLIGLPPTPEQIRQYVANPTQQAYAQLVDRLLDSPEFGERWGRHWLDVVRFAESSGGGRTLLFPDAWRYRDYVIDCFNNDHPYDQFLREQIAGDLMESKDWQDRRRKLVATAFLLLGPTNYELQDKDVLEMDVVDEQLDTIGKGMLGMTLGCARCHDHKFDPIPIEDYYAMAGILKSTKAMIHSNVSTWNTVELPLPPEQQARFETHQQRLASAKEALQRATRRWRELGGKDEPKSGTAGVKSIPIKSIAGIVVDDDQAERIGVWTQSTSTPGFVGPRYIHDDSSKKGQKSVVYRPQLPQPGRYEVSVSFPAFANRSTRVPVRIHHRDGQTIVKVNQQQPSKAENRLTSLGVFELDPQDEPSVVISTEGTEDGVVIADAVIFRLTDLPAAEEIVDVPANQFLPLESEREPLGHPGKDDPAALRQAKARMDRLAGQVKKLEADAPSRPVAMATGDDEDAGDIHLAIRGVVHNRGPMIRRGALQVASRHSFADIPAGQSGRQELADWMSDPGNPLPARVMANRVWYWLMGRGIVASVDNFGSMGRAPTHPELLDHLASSLIERGWSVKTLIRQIMLSRVYQLSSHADRGDHAADLDNQLWWRMNRKRLRAEDIRDTLLLVSGQLDRTRGGPNIKAGTKSEYGYRFQSRRRSVYVPVFRNTLPEIFEVFDFADPNIQSGQRTTSTIASQALLLMNHPQVIEQSKRAAEKMLRETGDSIEARVRYAYQQVIGRRPDEREMAIAVDFLAADSEDDPRDLRWAMLYQALFQSLDFRYLN
ncbi:MAG: DUF1553 domain-containing protein [Pirellulales bacterium]|nr:DUF1553 domain-containing protein [Pirellulales bacterium]